MITMFEGNESGHIISARRGPGFTNQRMNDDCLSAEEWRSPLHTLYSRVGYQHLLLSCPDPPPPPPLISDPPVTAAALLRGPTALHCAKGSGDNEIYVAIRVLIYAS